jgi:hypothetical protein
LPYSIRIPDWKALFVHAGLIPNLLVEQHSRGELTTLRNIITIGEEEGKTKFVATTRPEAGTPWINAWDEFQSHEEEHNRVHVYFGHDAKRGLQLGKFATGLDTGCLYGKYHSTINLTISCNVCWCNVFTGKKLTAIVLPSREIFQVDAKKEYVQVGARD